jgi:hypothetical protein
MAQHDFVTLLQHLRTGEVAAAALDRACYVPTVRGNTEGDLTTTERPPTMVGSAAIGPPPTPLVIGVVVPIALIAAILTLDAIESPKTAYVGVLSTIPLLSAVFARPPAVSISAGVTRWLPDEDVDAVLARADSAMNRAKSEGRCCVVASLDPA